jgi:nucleotide-binding universal stress UspA family protein
MDENTITQPIIVGVDGSAHSIHALQQAAELAVSLNCPLEAVTTWEYSVLHDPYYVKWSPDADWSPQNEARRVLETAVDDAFQGEPPLPVRTDVMRGRAAHVLTEMSRNARMLVLGSRGHGGFAGLLLGSVSAACAAHAQSPVLIIHAPKKDEELLGLIDEPELP